MYLSAQSVKINSRLFKGHRSIDTSNDFYLFILSWKAHDFSRENSKPHRESQITTRLVEPWFISSGFLSLTFF